MELEGVDKFLVKDYVDLMISLSAYDRGIVERLCMRYGLPRGRVFDVLEDFHVSLQRTVNTGGI